MDVSTLTPEEETQLLTAAARRLGARAFFDSLEELLTSPDGFGLTTATPLQRAICRIIEGRSLGVLERHPDVVSALGGSEAVKALKGRPDEVMIIAAIRTGKSVIAAAAAIWATQTCDLAGLLEGEIPRYCILSLSIDNAKVILQHLVAVLQKPKLQFLRAGAGAQDAGRWKSLLTDTDSALVGSEFVMHPSGRPIEIRVVAGARAGGSVVSRWLAGMALDEAPRMNSASEGVVNYTDTLEAALGRMLPGAQVFSIGSPWRPEGPVYDKVQEHWGHPTKHLVVIRARGPQMNPKWWTAAHCADLAAHNKSAYQINVLAEFADVDESMFPQTLLSKCTRTGPARIDWQAGHEYAAAIDPATRGNAWTLVIADRYRNRKRICLAVQWIGSPHDPLSPRVVMKEVRELLGEYDLDWCYSDQWAADALRDIAFQLGFNIVIEDWTEKSKIAAFLNLAAAMSDGSVDLPPDADVQRDLRLTQKIATQKGVGIRLASTSDGRHCDYAPAIARVLFRWIEDEKAVPPRKGEEGFSAYQEETLEKDDEMQYKKKDDSFWWEGDPWR